MLPSPQHSATSPPREGVLNVKNMAGRFEVSPRWIRNHARELGGSKIGGLWFFTWEGVSHVLQGGPILAVERINKNIAKREKSNGITRS